MIGKVLLLCVSEAESLDACEYVAHVQCSEKEDGKTLVSELQEREGVHQIEFVGYSFRDVCYPWSGTPVYRRDMFITLRYNADVSVREALLAITRELVMLIH